MVIICREEVRGSLVKNVLKKCWQKPSRSMGGRNVYVNSVPNPMRGRGGVAGDATATSRQGCGEITARRLRQTSEWSTGSSSSSGKEDKKSKTQEAEIKELRAQVEQLRRQQRGEAGQEGEGDPARRESGLEEDWNKDCEEPVENRKELDEQRRTLQTQLRDLEKFELVPPANS